MLSSQFLKPLLALQRFQLLQKDTLHIEGQENLGEFRAMIDGPSKNNSIRSSNGRFYCRKCGCHLWAYDESYKQWVYPYAGAIDTPLPTPPCSVHIMLNSKSSWVQPQASLLKYACNRLLTYGQRELILDIFYLRIYSGGSQGQ